MDVLCPSQSGHAVRHVAKKYDLSAFTTSRGRESWHADLRLRGELERKKKKRAKKTYDVHRVPHRPKRGARAAVIGRWSEQSWQRRVG
jgi:hypothetical protein